MYKNNIIKENFKVKYIAYNKWFIVYESEKPYLHLYLHKNLTLHDICGIANFFETESQAKSLLYLYFLRNNMINGFISDEEFMI